MGDMNNELKALVLEKTNGYYTVLTATGEFKRVRHQVRAEIGEEILLQEQKLARFGTWRAWMSAAALFLFTLLGVFGVNWWQAPNAVAYLSMDINPSVQLVLDREGRVLDIEANNQDAEELLKGLDLKGQAVREAVQVLVSQAISLNYLQEGNWVLVGVSAEEDGMPEKSVQLDNQEIIAWVEEAAQAQGITPQVALFEISPTEREAAAKEGLTLGEYGLWRTAQAAGVEVPAQNINEKEQRTKVLEQVRVQEQIKLENDKRALENGEKIDGDQNKGPAKPENGKTGNPNKSSSKNELNQPEGEQEDITVEGTKQEAGTERGDNEQEDNRQEDSEQGDEDKEQEQGDNEQEDSNKQWPGQTSNPDTGGTKQPGLSNSGSESAPGESEIGSNENEQEEDEEAEEAQADGVEHDGVEVDLEEESELAPTPD